MLLPPIAAIARALAPTARTRRLTRRATRVALGAHRRVVLVALLLAQPAAHLLVLVQVGVLLVARHGLGLLARAARRRRGGDRGAVHIGRLLPVVFAAARCPTLLDHHHVCHCFCVWIYQFHPNRSVVRGAFFSFFLFVS